MTRTEKHVDTVAAVLVWLTGAYAALIEDLGSNLCQVLVCFSMTHKNTRSNLNSDIELNLLMTQISNCYEC